MQDAFVQYLAQERRASPYTCKAYRNDLAQFSRYLQSRGAEVMERVDHKVIRGWIMYLSGQGQRPSTIKRKLATLGAFYKWLCRQQLLDENPMRKLNKPKLPRALPCFIQEEDMRKLFQHRFEDTLEGCRDKLILQLLYGTGMRCGELIALQVRDIYLTDCILKVQGKRHKERVVPFPSCVTPTLAAYDVHRTALLQSSSCETLLVTRRGKPCYPMLIYRIVRKYLRMYTHTDRYGPHVLRHTFATHLLDNAADLNDVKALLGHKTLAATQWYVHTSLDQNKQIFDRAHPRT